MTCIPTSLDGIRFVIALSLGVQHLMPRAKMATLKRIQFGGNVHSVWRKFGTHARSPKIFTFLNGSRAARLC